MKDFKLDEIYKLISFGELFGTDNEYMRELAYIHNVDLVSEAIYTLTTQTRVLFTPKLRYYAKRTEAAVNTYVKDYTRLLEGADSCQVKYVLKVTREAAETLIRLAGSIRFEFDNGDVYWNLIRSDAPNYTDFIKPTIERVVYMHVVTAELVRFWLEMQDRFADVVGTESRYDTSLIYSSLLNKQPDKEFEVQKIEREEAIKIGSKTIRTDCSFFLDAGDELAAAAQQFRNKLVGRGLLSEETDAKDMMSLLSGRPCRKQFRWIGDKHFLKWIIQGLIKEEIISTWPKGTSQWDVVSCRFIDKDGKPMTNDIRTEKTRKKAETVYEEVIDTLRGYV